jgi:molybdopterin-guanine dinucleotide biosynthesis protein A
MTERLHGICDGWVLSGGEGRRMGGQDKGLITVGSHPMAWQVAQRLAPQVQQVRMNANRNVQTYQSWPWPVYPDDADLPCHSGPMVGVLTGFRHSTAPWLQLAACDTPLLPNNLTSQLYRAVLAEGAHAAIPVTKQADGHVLWHHWTSALLAQSCKNDLFNAITQGERRLGKWITQQRWVAVLFDGTNEADMFVNINTPPAVDSISGITQR